MQCVRQNNGYDSSQICGHAARQKVPMCVADRVDAHQTAGGVKARDGYVGTAAHSAAAPAGFVG